MNREIKFRFWQKSLKRFMSQYYDGGERIVMSSEGRPLEWDEKTICEEIVMKNLREMSDDFVVQQYIGLNDINGQEIYEGDIVQIEPGWFYQFKHSGEIYFSETELGYYYKCTSHDKLKNNWNIGKTFECEVIGNIYEKRQS